jgi:aldehyde dehydrogenase (NAD+)
VGDPLDKSIDIGAIVDPVQRANIDRWVQRGVAEGAVLFQPECALPEAGCWYPPTLLTNVEPASTVAQEEIFGPVVVSMTFRTPAEAIALANNTRYGLAASIWTENINLALDAARRVKAGTVWINSTNLFDAASGFGGYRESGFGREGGQEGVWEYLRPKWQERPRPKLASVNGKWGDAVPARPTPLAAQSKASEKGLPALDRTAKLFIGGKQARSDGNYTRGVYGPQGELVGQAADGNRKDIREAVEAAHKASGWGYRNSHARAQILYYLAENLSARADEFAARIAAMTGRKDARAEVDAAIDRLFTYGAYADKYGGAVQETPVRGLTIALHEPVGVIGIACPDAYPLLALVALVAPAIARGNTVIVIPSEAHPLAATDFYQVLETSDVPAGVVNIVTGARDTLVKTLVEHDDVDAVWYFGTAEGSAHVEALSAGNMKRTWVSYGTAWDWLNAEQTAGEDFLREATQVKNIWTPSGE